MVVFISIFGRDGKFQRTECFDLLESATRYIESWLIAGHSLKIHLASPCPDIRVQSYADSQKRENVCPKCEKEHKGSGYEIASGDYVCLDCYTSMIDGASCE